MSISRRATERIVTTGLSSQNGGGMGRRGAAAGSVPSRGSLAEHAVQTKPDEQGDQGKDDDDGQSKVLNVVSRNIVRLS